MSWLIPVLNARVALEHVVRRFYKRRTHAPQLPAGPMIGDRRLLTSLAQCRNVELWMSSGTRDGTNVNQHSHVNTVQKLD
jgi:hypothetical protein